MKNQFLIEVTADPVRFKSADTQADLRQLIVDILKQGLERNKAFELDIDVKPANGDGPVAILCTKADAAQILKCTPRTVENWVKQKRLPEPIRVSAPHCTNGSPRWFRDDLYPHRD